MSKSRAKRRQMETPSPEQALRALLTPLSKHPIQRKGKTTFWARLTPRICQQILDICNIGNPRPVQEERVLRYAYLMERGLWEETHQGISFTTDGVMADGQHRLHAAVIANYTLEVQVTLGMTRQQTQAIDAGLQRQIYHRLSFSHEVDFTSRHSAICKAVLGLKAKEDDIWPFYVAHRGAVDFAAGLPSRKTGGRRLTGAPVYAAFFRAHVAKAADPAELEKCHEAWVTGAGPLSPALLAVRDKFMNGRYLRPTEKERREMCVTLQWWIRFWLTGNTRRKIFRGGKVNIYLLPGETPEADEADEAGDD